MSEQLRSFYDFLLYPYIIETSDASLKDKLLAIFMLFVVSFSSVVFIAGPLLMLAGVDDLTHKISDLESEISTTALFILAVVIAPLMEELVFRFPLRYRRGAILLLVLCLSMISFYIFQNIFSAKINATISGTIAIMGFILIGSLSSEKGLEKISNFLKNYYPWIFYLTAMMFAFAHIFNYDLPDEKWFLTPILVLPQLILGLFLGYVRLRFGIWASILMHAMNNFIPMMALVAAKGMGVE
jgi:membrane protease YdiL (CAAX protease family)